MILSKQLIQQKIRSSPRTVCVANTFIFNCYRGDFLYVIYGDCNFFFISLSISTIDLRKMKVFI